MNILSCFDGISAAKLALHNLNIDIDNYFSFEIDKFAIKISNKNWDDIVQLGDINRWKDFLHLFSNIDLIIGGFPCQDLSVARGGKLGFGSRSGLFFVLLEIIQTIQPKYFIVENVLGSISNRDIVTSLLGVSPVIINSALVTAQNRNRAYWCNFDISQPKDKNIILSDIIKNGYVNRIKSYCIDASYCYGLNFNSQSKSQSRLGRQVVYTTSECVYEKESVRKLLPEECEILQGFPEGYTGCVSKTQRYKALGNSFTVPVIEHLLKSMLNYESI